MGLNLIHVYMDRAKYRQHIQQLYQFRLDGFGVPIVKNLILFGWAAGNPISIKDINNGKDVPVYEL